MSEIDRLRRMEQFQANEEILSGRVVTDNSKVNENLLAENQRLRTALEQWNCGECYSGKVFIARGDCSGTCQHCNGTGRHPIASAALGGE